MGIYGYPGSDSLGRADIPLSTPKSGKICLYPDGGVPVLSPGSENTIKELSVKNQGFFRTAKLFL
jgi:hypothetical protein